LATVSYERTLARADSDDWGRTHTGRALMVALRRTDEWE
jgi:hypothetical protein